MKINNLSFISSLMEVDFQKENTVVIGLKKNITALQEQKKMCKNYSAESFFQYVYCLGGFFFVNLTIFEELELRKLPLLLKQIPDKSNIFIDPEIDDASLRIILVALQESGKESEIWTRSNPYFSSLLESIHLTQELVSQPSNIITPSFLVQKGKDIVSSFQNKIEIFHLKGTELAENKFNALYSVGKGSSNQPEFLFIRFKNGEKKFAIAGKGVTFDSGGLCLKDRKNMFEMFTDMAGAAVCLGVLNFCLKNDIKIDLAISLPLCENAVSGSGYKPSDIISSLSGLDIDVIDTDAEGRIILADAVYFLLQKGFKHICSIATLTGLAQAVFGPIMSPFITNRTYISERLQKVKEKSFDKVIQLTDADLYEGLISSKRDASVANMGNEKFGGIYSGANFIKHFITNEVDWFHVDIAGTTYHNFFSNSSRATGYGVDLLLNYIDVFLEEE